MDKDLVAERERKVTMMVFLMVFAFLGAWSGYALLCILRLFGIYSPDYAVGIAMMAAKAGGWLNTIVFIFMNTQVSKHRIFYNLLIETNVECIRISRII